MCVHAVTPLTETSGLRRRDQFLNEAANGLRHRSRNLNLEPHANTSLVSNRSDIISARRRALDLFLSAVLFIDWEIRIRISLGSPFNRSSGN